MPLKGRSQTASAQLETPEGLETQPLLLEQLHEIGIVEEKDRFHLEKDQILATGLEVSSYINVDDTGARHMGRNGYCTYIGNELFAKHAICFSSLIVTFDYHETIDADHGKIEVRRYWTTSGIDWLQGKEKWVKLKTICMVERERQFDDNTEHETSYYIGSIGDDAKQFGHAVRSHWGIENSLHWVLDMTFREDESRIRKGNAPENFAVLRHIALNLIKKETSLNKKSIKSKRLRAGWDNDYLLKVLNLNR
jgi:predicted transposase YbfD/YdcC